MREMIENVLKAIPRWWIVAVVACVMLLSILSIWSANSHDSPTVMPDAGSVGQSSAPDASDVPDASVSEDG